MQQQLTQEPGFSYSPLFFAYFRITTDDDTPMSLGGKHNSSVQAWHRSSTLMDSILSGAFNRTVTRRRNNAELMYTLSPVLVRLGFGSIQSPAGSKPSGRMSFNVVG